MSGAQENAQVDFCPDCGRVETWVALDGPWSGRSVCEICDALAPTDRAARRLWEAARWAGWLERRQ